MKWNDCIWCEGTGETQDNDAIIYGDYESVISCDECNGTGKAWSHFFKRPWWAFRYSGFYYCLTNRTSHCPDCKRLERVLWWELGDHKDCVPF